MNAVRPRSRRRITRPARVPRSGEAPQLGLGETGAALGLSTRHLDEARGLLSLMRDDIRRSLVELLAREPGASLDKLCERTGATPGDLLHRLRSLQRLGFVERRQHGWYALNAQAPKRIAEYFDLLIVIGSAHCNLGRCS